MEPNGIRCVGGCPAMPPCPRCARIKAREHLRDCAVAYMDEHDDVNSDPMRRLDLFNAYFEARTRLRELTKASEA